jgi:hypothetical protein
MNVRTLWMCWTIKIESSLRVRNVAPSTTLRTFAPTEGVALKSDQREQLECKHLTNRATGRKVRPNTDVASTALGKEELAVRL